MNNIKLVVIDLDGTVLIGNFIPKKNIEAIKKTLENNVKVVIATGRGPTKTKWVYDKLGLNKDNLPTICFNGALQFNFSNSNVLDSVAISSYNAKKIFSLAKEHNIIAWAFPLHNKSIYRTRKHNFISIYGMKTYKIKINEYDENNFSDDVYKFSFFGSKRNCKIFSEFLKKQIPDVKIFPYSFFGKKAYDIANIKCDKNEAIKNIAKKLDLKLEEIMAIGDGHNDIEMIKNSGLGIAMKNGNDKLKIIANDITSSGVLCSGVSKILHKYVIKK